MSRCASYAFCGMFFLLTVNSKVLAAEIMHTADAPLPISTLTLQSPASEVLEDFRFELGRRNPELIGFDQNEPSPLFTVQSEANPDASEWDYLWQNTSRIPITSIPEPTSGSLLIGGAILLCLRRMRKLNK